MNSMDMLIGRIPGTIGETSVIAIIIGAIFLIMLGIIDLRIPGTYIVTFVLFIGIFGQFSDANVGFFDPQFIHCRVVWRWSDVRCMVHGN